MTHNLRKLAAIFLTAAAVFSFSAVTAQAEPETGGTPAPAAEPTATAAAGKTPLAAYSLKDSDFKDYSGNNNPDIELDYEDESNPESRTDGERLQPDSHSGRAWAKPEGIKLANGFFKLPGTIFDSVSAEEIDGLTVSLTITKNESTWPGDEWSEILFSFSDNDLPYTEWDVGKREGTAFYASYSGNIGTAKNPFNSSGSQLGGWLDGSLYGVLPYGETHTVTVTYDIDSNRVLVYCDGALVNSSENTGFDVTAHLTAEEIKSFNSIIIGRPNAQQQGNWGFGIYSDVVIYPTALSSREVYKLAREGGWEAVASEADNVPVL